MFKPPVPPMTQNSKLKEWAMQDHYLVADNGRVPGVITQH